VVARLVSPAVLGLETSTVEVEVDLRAGLPAFSVVGLPDAAVQEARERVRSGLANQAFQVPARRIVANLAPADLRKAGPQYDLPLALAILCASGQVAPASLVGAGAVGELALDGSLRPVPGALAMAEHAARHGWRRLVVPRGNAAEATLVRGVEILGPATLRAAVDLLEGRTEPSPVRLDVHALLASGEGARGPDLAEVRGQGAARRALEVAAAGGHSMLMLGPPGGGKTMLARRLPGILPPLALDEAIEVTRIHSVAGLLDPGCPLVTRRPFRAPHHTISAAGLVGGGRLPRPGEVSLAHGGVLFLDEVCAFAPSALNALRQPLEEGRIDVARAMVSARFPARALLVCAGNPCPCGFDGDPVRRCVCPPGRAETYRARLSGPVLDRIDLHIEVPRLARDEVLAGGPSEPSAAVRARVGAAGRVAAGRGQAEPNARLGPAAARRAAALDPGGRALLGRAIDRLGLSARAHDRLLRVGRTIADLAGDERVTEQHLAEALGYRVAAEGVGAAA
jgi:magnesium chelatase family protein